MKDFITQNDLRASEARIIKTFVELFVEFEYSQREKNG